ncbi:hypothetical protein AAZX31_01G104000 [Glycine max]
MFLISYNWTPTPTVSHPSNISCLSPKDGTTAKFAFLAVHHHMKRKLKAHKVTNRGEVVFYIFWIQQ